MSLNFISRIFYVIFLSVKSHAKKKKMFCIMLAYIIIKQKIIVAKLLFHSHR